VDIGLCSQAGPLLGQLAKGWKDPSLPGQGCGPSELLGLTSHPTRLEGSPPIACLIWLRILKRSANTL
jgi:hypothetical protein